MKWIFCCFYVLGLVLSSSARCDKIEARDPGHEDVNVQTISGFKLVKDNKNTEFQRYEFRDEGQFLISNQGFTNRQQAIDFCKKQPGFELSDWLLPGVMAMSGLPFEDLKKNNIISDQILSGKDTLSGQDRSGVIFWTQPKTDKGKARFSGGTDVVYEFLDGCGPMCDGVETLSAINARLKKLKKPERKIQAICVSTELQKKISK